MPDDLLVFGILGWYIGKVLVYPRDRFTFFWSAIGTDSAPVACASLGQQSDAKSLSQGGLNATRRTLWTNVRAPCSFHVSKKIYTNLYLNTPLVSFGNVCW